MPRSPRRPQHRSARPPQRLRATSTAPVRRSRSNESPASGRALDRALAEAASQPQPEASSFGGYGLPPALVTVLARRGFHTPFAIQSRTLPGALAGRDILARSQTGSGKTLAFGIAMLARLHHGQSRPRSPRGLVLVPTRELAQQVSAVVAPLAHALSMRVTAIYGGAPMGRQIDSLRRGVDVVIATPGRLLDLIERGECSLADVEVTVLDEADFMADLGFLPAVTTLLDQTRPNGQRMLFSATLDNGVDTVVRRYLSDPQLHALAPTPTPVSTMDHRAFTVRAEDKVAIAAEIAERPGRTLFFVRTKHGADRLATQLRRSGARAGAIHGNLRQSQRQRALDAFSRGEARVLVATDVAARGIHVDDIDLVVHYDPPADAKDYLHRSGRTARAGADGVVLSLLLPEQVGGAARMHERAGVTARPVQIGRGAPQLRNLGSTTLGSAQASART
jgi:superfamily II DNA/RNA helicase